MRNTRKKKYYSAQREKKTEREARRGVCSSVRCPAGRHVTCGVARDVALPSLAARQIHSSLSGALGDAKYTYSNLPLYNNNKKNAIDASAATQQYYLKSNLHPVMLTTTHDASDGRDKAHWRAKKMMHLKLKKQEPCKGKQGLGYVCNKTFGD